LVRRHVLKTIDALFSVRGFLLVCLLLLLFMASILFNPVPLPSMLGTLTLVALFLATGLIACASATARYRIPIVSTLVLLGAVPKVVGIW
jgi:hypothetical protein